MCSNTVFNINNLPLGLSDFSNIRESRMIYVDKTELISKIARRRTPIFFSRPRRFGKSLLINTLHSLFSKGLEDFCGLDLEKTWNDTTYKVVHIDFSGIASRNSNSFIRAFTRRIIQQFKKNNKFSFSNSLCDEYPADVLDDICQHLDNNSVVLLIDEYDAPLTHHLDRPDELQDIVEILNDFYAVAKQYTDKFRLIFITGVTRISHVSIFSAFNNIIDLSLKNEFNSLLGFTRKDLIQYFDQYIENAAFTLKISKNDVYKRLEQYYDGFQFSIDAEETLYNPWSILSFFCNPQEGFYNYWFESGGRSSLIMQYLKINDSFDILNYQNRKIIKTKKELSARYDITTVPKEILLLQTGYFTIRKETNQIARLIFPNTEVEDSILDLYLAANHIKFRDEIRYQIDELSKNIDQKNLPAIISVFNDILNDCVSILSKIFDDERSVRDIIYAALPQEPYLQKIKERETVKGFSDLEILTKKTRMVIEFKRTNPNRDAETSLQEAIKQIRDKNYGIVFFQNLELYRVAMVISSDDKAILPNFCMEVL